LQKDLYEADDDDNDDDDDEEFCHVIWKFITREQYCKAPAKAAEIALLEDVTIPLNKSHNF